MIPKSLILLFLLIVCFSTFECRNLLKKLQKRQVRASFLNELTTGRNIKNWLREKRDASDSSSAESGEVSPGLQKFFMSVAWKESKTDVLTGFLEEASSSDNNLTIIAWQRIMDDSGNIKIINTIQLVIPPKPQDADAPTNIVDENEEEDFGRSVPHEQLSVAKEYFEPLEALGIPISITTEEFSSDGENTLLLYLDKDEVYTRNEGFAIYNKTINGSPSEATNLIQRAAKSTLGKPTILRYDRSNSLLKSESQIYPHLLGFVQDYHEIPDNILDEAPGVIAKITQTYPLDEVAKQLFTYYNLAYPQYKWKVLTDPSNTYVVRDVSITLTYDNFDLYEESNINWYVYGTKQ